MLETLLLTTGIDIWTLILTLTSEIFGQKLKSLFSTAQKHWTTAENLIMYFFALIEQKEENKNCSYYYFMMILQ